jgi:hypothetical protein
LGRRGKRDAPALARGIEVSARQERIDFMKPNG